MVLPMGAVPLAIVIETNGILQRCASSTSAAAADGVKVVAAAPISSWATNETVGCAALPEGMPISAFLSTSPMAAMFSRQPTTAPIAGPRPVFLPTPHLQLDVACYANVVCTHYILTTPSTHLTFTRFSPPPQPQ